MFQLEIIFYLTGVCGEPEENEAHPGHFAEEQSEADRVPVQLSHRASRRRPV